MHQPARHKLVTPLFVIEFVDTLEDTRKKLGLSRLDIAKSTGLSYPCITQYELGYSYPAKENYNKLAAFFHWVIWD